MEKTKKLFAYVVVFVAIVSLFIAGITVQNTLSYAAGSTTYEGEITKVDGATKLDGTPIAAGDIKIIFDNAKATIQQKSVISQAETEVAQNTLGKAVLDKIDEIAKTIAKDQEVDHSAIVYEKPFTVEFVTEGPAKVTFSTKDIADGVDFILFKSKATGAWSVIEPETAANAAMNAPGDNNAVTFKLPGSGTVVFGHYSQAKADQVKAAKTADKDKACCTCCNKNCPFCSFLCKDGKCYCWTMYVVIVLAAILVVLIVALVIVKAKAKKKAVAAKEEPAEEVAAETEKKPEENEEK